MEVTLSSKYQIVIPKKVRIMMGVTSGQKLQFGEVTPEGVMIRKQPTADEYIDKYAGSLKDTPWQKAGIDAAVWLRKDRDEE